MRKLDKSGKSTRITIRVSLPTKRKLDECARKHNSSVSNLLRFVIKFILKIA